MFYEVSKEVFDKLPDSGGKRGPCCQNRKGSVCQGRKRPLDEQIEEHRLVTAKRSR